MTLCINTLSSSRGERPVGSEYRDMGETLRSENLMGRWV
jgi:hypothetical protein